MNVRQLPHHGHLRVTPRPIIRKNDGRRAATSARVWLGRYEVPACIGHNERVRRSFAGLFFGMAFACACLAISGFVLQRTAFSPSNTEDSAKVVLDDAALEEALAN